MKEETAPGATDPGAVVPWARDAVVAPAAWDFLTGNLARDRRNARLLMATVQEVYTAVDPEVRMRRAVDRAIELTGAERGILFCLAGDVPVPFVARDGRGGDLPLDLPYTHTAVEAVRSAGGFLRQARTPDDDVKVSASFAGLLLYSVMTARLDYEGRPLAVLYLDNRSRNTQEFSANDEKVFRAITGLVTAALENTRLEREGAERVRMERQIALAREVQEGLVPHDIEAPAGYDIAGAGRVCQDLSGDYYDVLPRADGRLGLVVADVSGHSIRSALHMVTTRALVRRMLGCDEEPDVTLDTLHEFLRRDMREGQFVSLFAGLLEPATGTVTWASAGHNPPYVRRRDGTIEELWRTGPILAVLKDPTYRMGTPVVLRSGDVLLLYTDGLCEARGTDGTLWGDERLLASFDRHAASGGPAQTVLDGILADLDAFRGNRPLEDDITCLVLRR